MGNQDNLSRFFSRGDYFIDEKVAFLKFVNTYKVYDCDGIQIGVIRETMPAFLKILSLFVNKGLFPFRLDIMDMEDNVLVTIKRGWTFWMSKIRLEDADGVLLAFIRQKFRFLHPSFTILDAEERELAVITGDWKAWNFSIEDAGQKQLGVITKKWNGILKEAFTTADKYVVSMFPGTEIERKIPILAAAITIDMVLKESK